MRTLARNRFLRFACLLAATVLVLSPAFAADKKPGEKEPKPAAPAQMSEQEMMALYMKYATPGPEHEVLKSWAGNWKVVSKSWMAPGEPQVSEGRVVRSMVLGGRYLQDEYKAILMGQPFEGMGITGYDLYKKEWVSFWIDTMGTGFLLARGKMDPSGKVMTMTATYDDPATGEKKSIKEITKIVDANQQVFEMWESRGGKEVKSMELTYTRE